MSKPGLRYVSMMVSVGVVSLALVQCGSSSGAGGSLDGGKGGSTGATTGSGGGPTATTATGTTTTGTGTGTGGAGGGPPGNCPAMANDDMCTTCLKSKCCSEINACASDAQCAGLSMCAAACADNACIQNCFNQFPQGLNALQAILDCQMTNCATECM